MADHPPVPDDAHAAFDGHRRQERERIERDRIERGMVERLARAVEMPKVPFLPLSYLTPAALELRYQFIDGNWYGCILLALGLADGLTKHVATSHGLNPQQGADAIERANYLQHKGALSPAAYAACAKIWGTAKERGHFVHFNAQLETDPVRLEARARASVFGVYELQADLFGFDLVKGRVRQHHPKLWPEGDQPGTTSAFIDFT
jgi:hypothetical protein